jgi:hypothetical protein
MEGDMTVAVSRPPAWVREARDWADRAVAAGATSVSTRQMAAATQMARDAIRGGWRDRFVRLSLLMGTGLPAMLTPLFRSQSWNGTTYGSTTDANTNFVSGDYTQAAGLRKASNTNAFLDTGVLANFTTAANAHLGFGLLATETRAAAYRCLIGAYNGTANSLAIEVRYPLATQLPCYFTRFGTASDTCGDNIGTGGSALAVGNIVASWPTMYRNGAASGTNATTSQDYPSAHRIYVFANNNANATSINHTDARGGWYSIGLTMTLSQVQAFNAAIGRFYSILGRS